MKIHLFKDLQYKHCHWSSLQHIHSTWWSINTPCRCFYVGSQAFALICWIRVNGLEFFWVLCWPIWGAMWENPRIPISISDFKYLYLGNLRLHLSQMRSSNLLWSTMPRPKNMSPCAKLQLMKWRRRGSVWHLLLLSLNQHLLNSRERKNQSLNQSLSIQGIEEKMIFGTTYVDNIPI